MMILALDTPRSAISYYFAYRTAGRTTKKSLICKNKIYIFILRQRRLCVVGIQSERVLTYISFYEVVQLPENIYEELTGLFV